MATYAIGDIHGCLTALTTIFDQGLIQEEDTVVFLGDYVDRGPDSKGVIDWLLENKNNYHFEFILGNHEIMMLESRYNPKAASDWVKFGGAETLTSYQLKHNKGWIDKIDTSHWQFMEDCRPYFELEDFIFVHAGLEPDKELIDQDHHHLFWKKYEIPEQYSKNKTVVCGHTSRKNGEIADFGHTICIDTYAYGGQWLTCLNVESMEYLKANNNGQLTAGKL